MDSISKRYTARVITSLGLVMGLGAAGCDRADVKVYQAPKDPVAARPTPNEAPSAAPAQLHWTLPSGWQELPAGQMRVGHFVAKGTNDAEAQITIIPLSGQGGGDLENVNRWRGQVGQPRLTESEINQLAEPVEIAGAPGRLFDFAGKTADEDKPARLVASILHRGGTAWFFKMIGDDALVAAQKPLFVAFLKSVHFSDGSPHPHAAAPAEPPVARTPAPPPAPPPAAGKPAWTVPAGWQEQAPGAMQRAKFTASSDAGQAEITVSALPGDAGGKLPNIQRWCGQIGLPPVAEADLARSLIPLEIPGAETYAVDLVAAANKRRLVAAAVARGGQTWFYKLMGDEGAVGREKAAFLKFVQTVGYGQ